ncbi:MAG: cyanophycinase [Caldithrix sp.]|nr:cyanophycinase [Caldithrix sp.]
MNGITINALLNHTKNKCKHLFILSGNDAMILKSLNIIVYLLVSMLFFSCSTNKQSSHYRGHLIIIGGGSRPEAVMQKFIQLAGGEEARIAIIPTASSHYQESGKRCVEEMQNYGVQEARAFHILSQEQANSDSMVNALQNYSGIFFGGGNQNRLTEFINGTRTLQVLHKMYQEGKTLGGTSAGAAVMSSIMITGDGNWSILQKDSVISTPGFGMLKEAIIDQHFIARKRFNRLLNLVIQNKVDGIGIDERTALWVKPDLKVEVMGKSVVIHLDVDRTSCPTETDLSTLRAQNIMLNVYGKGDQFQL